MSLMKTYKAAVGVRGDCLYCPLSLSIDSYWNCLVDCHHCWVRRLNHVWGTDLRPANPEDVERKLVNGLKNKNPHTTLAHALYRKKTLRLGNKSDPYQPAELQYEVSHQILQILIKLKWSFVIQTRFVNTLYRDEALLSSANEEGLLSIMPVISPGGDIDQELLERGRTPTIDKRLKYIKQYIKLGYNVGVNGEPFIPGFHTVSQFEDMVVRLKSIGVKSYNTYNFHFNDFVAKRLCNIGVDIEKIWKYNQDQHWKKIQQQLCDIAKKHDMLLGCPDFVNTGPEWKEKANTCCGINVPNPTRGNTHYWKRLLQKGYTPEQVLEKTWEGIGDKDLAQKILHGTKCDNYTMKDAGLYNGNEMLQ